LVPPLLLPLRLRICCLLLLALLALRSRSSSQQLQVILAVTAVAECRDAQLLPQPAAHLALRWAALRLQQAAESAEEGLLQRLLRCR
jgi:hypothetical protein